MIIKDYPNFNKLTEGMRDELSSYFASLKEGISEHTFAGMYLFRETHNYRVARIADDVIIFMGEDSLEGARDTFFMLPFGLPEEALLRDLFGEFKELKCAGEGVADELKALGFRVTEDRDNFDYLYLREDMAALTGRRFHRKKNLVNTFISHHNYEARPLLKEYLGDALSILDAWMSEKEHKDDAADCIAAREALLRMEELALCGCIYYVEGKPAAYTLGEESSSKDTFLIHFEKAVSGYKGLSQFVGQSFASILPDKYIYINREQDLGLEGLRTSKTSLRPIGFVKKFRVRV
jgi:hypothetical protein